ncbi:MAG: plasmid stabilization system [Gammaproteobacteria bacterium CG22_combo_CG10-13_8_21_14_all_40_8]|nr:MAG: plasmid stabilization system [Gammaproteobacteria bacterium CG22_combo_CG10-13_8_21_14_all_40_8]
MSYEIVWLVSAAQDVARLKEFIQQKNPAAAQRAARRIKEAVKILAENSEAGKPVEELHSFRDLFIPYGSGNYVLRYRKEKNKVIISKVKHSREEDF